MKTATVTELKNSLSAHLKQVAAGQPLVITDRKKPVAILHPLTEKNANQRLSGLIAAGVVAPPQDRLDVNKFLKTSKGTCRKSLASTIVEERNDR